MATCPRCGRWVETLHPMPPEVITKQLVARVRREDGVADLDACARCVNDLMEQW